MKNKLNINEEIVNAFKDRLIEELQDNLGENFEIFARIVIRHENHDDFFYAYGEPHRGWEITINSNTEIYQKFYSAMPKIIEKFVIEYLGDEYNEEDCNEEGILEIINDIGEEEINDFVFTLCEQYKIFGNLMWVFDLFNDTDSGKKEFKRAKQKLIKACYDNVKNNLGFDIS